jgi:hypothetical protein
MRTILVCALAVFSLASIATAEASCRDTRQACERLCRDLRGELHRVETELRGVTGNGGWEGSTRTSAELSREEAAACSDPTRRTRVQGVGTYGHQTGYRSGFNCNTRSAQTVHNRNVRQTEQLRHQLEDLQTRAERNDCLDEIPLIERLLHAVF